MQISESTQGDVLVLLPGITRLDAAIAGQFKDAVAAQCAAGATKLVLDLRKVDFVDSSGLGALVAVLKLVSQGGQLALVLPGSGAQIRTLLRLTRMEQVFALFDTVEAAVASVQN